MNLRKIFNQDKSLKNAKLVLGLIEAEKEGIESLMRKINDPGQLQAYLAEKEISKDDLLKAIIQMQLDMMGAYLAIVNTHKDLFETPGGGAVTQTGIAEMKEKVWLVLCDEFGLNPDSII